MKNAGLTKCRRGWDVMTQRRRANLERASGDKPVPILNRLIDLHDNGGEHVVTLEPDPRHMDLLRDWCGLECEGSRCHDTWRQKKLINCDETLSATSQFSHLWRRDLQDT